MILKIFDPYTCSAREIGEVTQFKTPKRSKLTSIGILEKIRPPFAFIKIYKDKEKYVKGVIKRYGKTEDKILYQEETHPLTTIFK